MLGKSVALIADSRNNLLSVLYEGRWLYHHNEELFYALTEDEQSEANLSHARRIVSDPITEKYIQRYIHRSENIDHEAARIVADEKKQKRYKNMIKNIDPHITCYLKLDSLPELLDAKHMAAIIL